MLMKARTFTLVVFLGFLLAVAGVQAVEKPGRNLITVKFKEIDAKGYPVIAITNATGKDIDDVRGSWIIEDLDGNVLFGSGQTEAVPGSIFLAAGETKDWVPYGLKRKGELMRRLTTSPRSVRFFFEARSLTYMDGTSEPLTP
jgi:hypothetical protein